jgi:hypothetical protein
MEPMAFFLNKVAPRNPWIQFFGAMWSQGTIHPNSGHSRLPSTWFDCVDEAQSIGINFISYGCRWACFWVICVLPISDVFCADP